MAQPRRAIDGRRPALDRQRVFGVGAANTGTHTVGAMFADTVPSLHEADAENLIRLHLDRVATGDATALHRYLKARDRRRMLTVDASQLNIYLLNDLEALFQGNRYVLTVRHPVRWLRSMIDDSLRRDVSETWIRFRRYRFGEPTGHPSQQRALAERGLFTLQGYLSYWRDAIERVHASCPADRLLVVTTRTLSSHAAEIARFASIGPLAAPPTIRRTFSNPTRFGVLERVPAPYLIDIVSEACGEWVERFFPDEPVAATVAQLS